MQYVIPIQAQPSVAVSGSDARFPVHRIYCIGRNYVAHAIEMGKNPDRDPPFFFLKPGDAVVDNGARISYPPGTQNYHYEMELVVAIGKTCTNVSVDEALDYVYGYGVGLDMTRRDLQMAAREKGLPWDTGKGFDRSAPCSAIHPVAEVGHPDRGRIWLAVNGEVKQDSDLHKMIWSVPEQISILSQYYTLLPGDLIYAGTPEGVGPVVAGDGITGGVEGVDEIRVTIV